MKKLIIYSALVALFGFVQCYNRTKKAELEKLKAQREQLNTQIAQLEDRN